MVSIILSPGTEKRDVKEEIIFILPNLCVDYTDAIRGYFICDVER